MAAEKKYLLDETGAARKLERMAYEIAEELIGETSPVILAGIRDNGVVMAKSLAGLLRSIASLETEIIEVSLDKRTPGEIVLSNSKNFSDCIIILVDDVTNSGKTLLYALQPFLNGYPKKIQILTLIERTHKAFPIKADYVGVSLATTLQEHIFVEVDGDRVTGAYLV